MEPLSNVLEFYGGNEEKMRKKEEDFVAHPEEQNIQSEIKKINKNAQGNFVRTPKPFKNEV